MYNHKKIEEKWRNSLNPKMPAEAPKYYCLDMFPYPSASGLHVGHWRGYVLSDVISRYKMLQGYDVLHPMGFDAFGLPAENFAIKSKIHPEEVTKTSIENYKRQLEDIGATYDWNNSVNTTDPEFYKWTQWIFLKMFEEGLAYEKEMPLNWCPTCKVVKANEEVTGGVCDRCGNETTKKLLRQWMLRITKYADRLLEGLDELEWPEKVKKMQKEWIGKSHGANIKFKLSNGAEITAFTTRPDTIFGATFIVLAPEHELLKNSENKEVEDYIKKTANKSNIERMAEKEKTGVFTGLTATNPLSGEEMKIYTADYVLIEYGTGAIMAVPGHDERDYEFATKYNLPIKKVIQEEACESKSKGAYIGDGQIINSGKYNGKGNREAISEIIADLEEIGAGESHISYKLRDWVFSRQRYWGEPIPLVHCPDCGIVAVPESELPIKLPFTENYEPTDTGESPLANIPEFVNCSCPKCSKPAKRETNTMPQWAGSSWYFLRYVDPHNDKELASYEALKALPVDMYIGGVEHAVLHLLYARFYTKFLYDIGAVHFEEPFKRLFNQGMLNYNGKKMSKSLGNIVNPDDVIAKYGRDTLRMYELFVAPAELDTDWDDSGIEGVYRFLSRFYKLVIENIVPHTEELEKIRHKLIKDITGRMEDFAFNTAISKFMEYSNQLSKGISIEVAKTFITLLSPFVPFIASELWENFDNSELFRQTWPTYDEEKTIDAEVEIAIQINGKLRATLDINKDEVKDIVIAKAKEVLGDKLEGSVVKEIYIPGKIVNIVVK
ncbi:MAG: leucine--tRNA ligase [Defluviitaleaceae bacterium]|nr:leucine--tRNA ligase [Defluviitaleaceae bacterium]